MWIIVSVNRTLFFWTRILWIPVDARDDAHGRSLNAFSDLRRRLLRPLGSYNRWLLKTPNADTGVSMPILSRAISSPQLGGGVIDLTNTYNSQDTLPPQSDLTAVE